MPRSSRIAARCGVPLGTGQRGENVKEMVMAKVGLPCPTCEAIVTEDSIYVKTAWECKGPNFDGLVYTQEIALAKLSDGCDVEMVRIMRHRH